MSDPVDLSPDDLLAQATCAVLIDGKVKGTAWLASGDGYLLTAGHLLGTDKPRAEVEVRFVEDAPHKAHKVQWGYQREMGIDFAVLKLVSPPANRHSLPVSLARKVDGTFRLHGYGVTLKDQSIGVGEFIGPFDPQDSPSNRLFELDSKQLGEAGYSGAAIFSDKSQAVVAVQIEATKAIAGPGRDTILAMPLYRIARHWEPLIRIGKENLESAILDVLFDHYSSHPDSPEMTFTELYEAIGISSNERGEVWYQLFSLQEKGGVKYQSLPDGSDSAVEILSAGIKVAQDRPKIFASTPKESSEPREERKDESTKIISELDTVEPLTTIEDFIQKEQDCAPLIRRDELLYEIKECLTQTSDRLIVVYGQPLVGKTKLLERLAETLGDEYVPLMVTGQGLDTSGLDAFAFDLADQLTNKFKKWARRHGVSFTLNVPKWGDFGGGNGRRAFHAHWNHLRQMAGERPLVLICDEIEHLLDYPEKLDPRIPTFLGEFMHSLENGYFVLAASERIRFSSNREISMLVAEGRAIRIPYYDERSALLIFSALRRYIIYEDGTLQYCVTLCDGHPRLLQAVFEAIVSQTAGPQSRRKSAKSDIEPIEETVIERASDSLWALCHDLSPDERFVVWLISREVSSPIKRLVYSLGELVSLADQHLRQSTVDLVKGIEHLQHREWVEWESREKGIFRFKLGIFPLWVQRHCIGINPATMEFIYH